MQQRTVAMINLQLYIASTEASVTAMVRLCGATELHKAANLQKFFNLNSTIFCHVQFREYLFNLKSFILMSDIHDKCSQKGDKIKQKYSHIKI
jgi:hypothetical protein